jgi:hypothetical protein
LGYRWGYGFPWGYYGFYDPYWWWDSDSGAAQDQDYYDDRAYADQMNQQSLEEQQMRQPGDPDIYPQSAPQKDSGGVARNEVIPPTVLVFRDQRKQEVQNYAIVGETLWNFSPQRTEKIPLSDLDVAATMKANADHGVDFRLPNAPEGQ